MSGKSRKTEREGGTENTALTTRTGGGGELRGLVTKADKKGGGLENDEQEKHIRGTLAGGRREKIPQTG